MALIFTGQVWLGMIVAIPPILVVWRVDGQAQRERKKAAFENLEMQAREMSPEERADAFKAIQRQFGSRDRSVRALGEEIENLDEGEIKPGD